MKDEPQSSTDTQESSEARSTNPHLLLEPADREPWSSEPRLGQQEDTTKDGSDAIDINLALRWLHIMDADSGAHSPL